MIRSLTKKDLSVYVMQREDTCCECTFKYVWFYMCCPLYYLQQEQND